MAETEDACAGCSLQPLELSLVLVCSHRLCLGCAREQLQGALATCPSCGRATSVEAAAAQQIEGFSAPRARNRVDVKRVDLASASARGQESLQSSWRAGSPSITLPSPSSPVTPAGWEKPQALPRPTRTSPALTSIASPAPAVPACGQCQLQGAEVKCIQCDELFCSSCFKQIHRAGRMQEHRSSRVSRRPAGNPTESDTSYCPQHGEALRFFCRDCQECICADCVVQRGRLHHGHDVVSAQTAFQELLRPMQELVDDAARKPARKQELLESLEKGRLDTETSRLALHDALKSQEELTLKAMEGLSRAADGALLEKRRRCEENSTHVARLREWLDVLRSELPKNEMNDVLKVNMYMKVKSGFAAMLPRDAGSLVPVLLASFWLVSWMPHLS